MKMKKIDAEEELTRLLMEEINKNIPLKDLEDVNEKNFYIVKKFLLEQDSLTEEQKNKIKNSKYIRKD